MFRAPSAFLWALLRPLLRLILRIRLRVTAPILHTQRPFVLLCNHTNFYDPLLAAVSVRRPLCFVGADRPPRRGFLLRLARSLCLPEELSLDEALRQAAARECCLGLFPEGTRCADGQTGPIPGALAKKLKESGLDLVILRVSGGYWTAPRWAELIPRPGRIRVRVARTLSAGMLRDMTADELQALIEKDLREDACQSVKKHPAPYRGEHRAERLERLLYLCPKCGARSRLESRDDEIVCRACGFATRYTLTGGFRGGGTPFEDLRQWLNWQDERLRQLCENAGAEPLFSDGSCELYDLNGETDERVCSGELTLYRDRLELPNGVAISVEELGCMRQIDDRGLALESRRGSRFALYRVRPLCAGKYIDALKQLKDIQNEDRGQKT